MIATNHGIYLYKPKRVLVYTLKTCKYQLSKVFIFWSCSSVILGMWCYGLILLLTWKCRAIFTVCIAWVLEQPCSLVMFEHMDERSPYFKQDLYGFLLCSHKNCYEIRCNPVSELALLQMSFCNRVSELALLQISWTSKVAAFIHVCFIGFLCIYLCTFLINFLCQNWSAWAVGATINQLKCHHTLQACHSLQKSYLKVLKIRLYRTEGWLKSCATKYVLASFTMCGNRMHLLQNQIYGNTVYFQIQNSGFSFAPTQIQDMPLQFVFDRVSLKYSFSECVHIVEQYFCSESCVNIDTKFWEGYLNLPIGN
jgi:hypothetical protein